jgi:cytochrome b561
MATPKRYHPALVVLHWLSALLIILMLVIGFGMLEDLPNNQAKAPMLAVHMTIGLTILALTIIRLVVRFSTKKPAPATAGNALLDKIGVATHWLLYLGALGMGLSGLGIATMAGILPLVGGGSATVPPDFMVFPPRLGHGLISSLLSILILLHIGAALYHQLMRKDGLLGRMWFGQ